MATDTAIDVVMPQMGVSVSEGTITKWLKQEGESVEADEPLLEISTDKIDTEVPSPGVGHGDADPRPGGRDGRRRARSWPRSAERRRPVGGSAARRRPQPEAEAPEPAAEAPPEPATRRPRPARRRPGATPEPRAALRQRQGVRLAGRRADRVRARRRSGTGRTAPAAAAA